MSDTPEQKKFLVLNLVQEVGIKDAQGNDATLRFNGLGFFGMCPVFVTRKGAEDYVIQNGLSLDQIVELKG